MIGGKDKDVQIQRRDRLDGGLNARSAPFTVEESQVGAIKNIGFQEEGSLVVRRFATTLLQSTWAGAGVLPAPVLTQIVGGGTLPAANFTAVIAYSNNTGGFAFGRITNPSQVSNVLAVNLNDRIQIDVFPNNLGEGQGQGSDGADDPFNGFVPDKSNSVPTSIPTFKKAGDPNFTQQAGITFVWNVAARAQRATLAAYAIGATLATQDHNFPLRFLFWNPATQGLIGITVDNAIQFAGDFSSFTRFGIAVDKAGNQHFWSRLPTRMYAAYLDQFPVISDNLGRPKRLHWTGSIATSNWRLIGANPPATKPTTALNAVAGLLNGSYTYKVAFVYRNGRGDLTTSDIESNATAASTPAIAPVNQKIDVTIPGSLETGLQFRRVYRTSGAGTVFLFHSDQAAGTGNLTFTDNTADSGLGISTPVNDVGKDPNDVPQNKLAFITQHNQRLFAFKSNYLVDASNRIIDFIATNNLVMSKASGSNTSENIDAWPSTFPIFPCGDATPPTGLLSHRGVLYFFKGKSIGHLVGTDETDLVPSEIFQNVGAMRNSMISVGSLIYFWEDARCGMVFDGFSVQQLGYVIQNAWNDDRDAGFYPWAVWYDPNRQEIHWQMTNQNIAPGVAGGASLAFKEYVLFIPSKAWTIYDSPDSGTNVDLRSIQAAARVVLAADIGRQVYTEVLANANGVAMKEAGTAADVGPAPDGGGPKTIRVDLKVFFGEDWQSVMTVRALALYSVMGNNAGASIAVAMALLNNPTFVTVATLTPDVARPSDRIDIIDIPQNVFKDVAAFNTISQDRGLAVRLTIVQGSATSVTIRGVALRYKDMGDMQRNP